MPHIHPHPGRWLAALLAALSLAVSAHAKAAPSPEAAAIAAAPLRIMCIGDSITEGSGGGYRLGLFNRITAAAAMPNMVGHRNGRASDPPDFIDMDHDGYGAYRINQMVNGKAFWGEPPLAQRLADWDPAVVTIHAGTNDAQQNYFFDGDASKGIAPVIDRLDELVSTVVAYNPAIHVFVAQIVPANAPASATTMDYVRRLNALVPGLVARHHALGHRVHLVDHYTPLLAHPHPDGIHPSAEGYAVMAEVWFEAMRAVGVLPKNFNPGRDDGVRQIDRYSTSDTLPWVLAPRSLIRAGAPTLAGAQSKGFRGSGGSAPLAALNDGTLEGVVNDGDNRWTTTFSLNTAAQTAGYRVREIRVTAGLPMELATGDERAHQAYEIWYATVNAPTVMKKLGGFHHILVNRAEQSAQVVIRPKAGQAALMEGVGTIEFRFVEPPRRNFGFYGIKNAAFYRELEVIGEAMTAASP